jgi:hypothetical protein
MHFLYINQIFLYSQDINLQPNIDLHNKQSNSNKERDLVNNPGGRTEIRVNIIGKTREGSEIHQLRLKANGL